MSVCVGVRGGALASWQAQSSTLSAAVFSGRSTPSSRRDGNRLPSSRIVIGVFAPGTVAEASAYSSLGTSPKKAPKRSRRAARIGKSSPEPFPSPEPLPSREPRRRARTVTGRPGGSGVPVGSKSCPLTWTVGGRSGSVGARAPLGRARRPEESRAREEPRERGSCRQRSSPRALRPRSGPSGR
jgi:hypothetical protein